MLLTVCHYRGAAKTHLAEAKHDKDSHGGGQNYTVGDGTVSAVCDLHKKTQDSCENLLAEL